jgi:PAS domain S-box-containing protein
LETANEELKSTNEELQSSNEELQSTNEELETSKEELQSVNEELTTVNAEHQQKIEELCKASSDLNNLLSSTEVGTIFLDKNLLIQRFTPSVTDFINLIHSDIGRPVAHIVSNIDYDGLVDDAKEVLRRLTAKEREVQTKDHRWYQMRILPYRTIDNVIEGVVVTFSEITRLKEALNKLEESRQVAEVEACRRRDMMDELQKREFWEIVADTAHEAILILNKKFGIEEANQAFLKIAGARKEDVMGRSLFDIADGYWNVPELRTLLEQVLPEKTIIQDYRMERNFEGHGSRVMLLNAKRLQAGSLFPDRIILALHDTTDIEHRARKVAE